MIPVFRINLTCMLGGVVCVVVVALRRGIIGEEDCSATLAAAVGRRAVRDIAAEYQNIARRTFYMLEGQPVLIFCTKASRGHESHTLQRCQTLLLLLLTLALLNTDWAEATCGNLQAAVQAGSRVHCHHRSDVIVREPDICRSVLMRCETATA